MMEEGHAWCVLRGGFEVLDEALLWMSVTTPFLNSGDSQTGIRPLNLSLYFV